MSRKIDMEAKLFMFVLHLKEDKNKKYSSVEGDKHITYLFDSYDEFKSYFVNNGFPDISKDVLELCRMKTTKKGTVIALKGICDHAIRRHMELTSENSVQSFDVLAVHNPMAFVVSPDKVEDFKSVKPDPKVREQIEKMAQQFEVNNLTEGPSLVRRVTFDKK